MRPPARRVAGPEGPTEGAGRVSAWTSLSPRTIELQGSAQAFVDERLVPGAAVYAEQVAESGDPHFHPPVMEELKAEARRRGLWNLFRAGRAITRRLTNVEYAPL